MKYGKAHFMQVSRDIWECELSDKAKLLYFWLCELEQRYTGKDRSYFFHTDAELCKELGWSLKTLRKAKKELKEKATEFVKFSYVNWWLDEAHTKLSSNHVTGYTILK